MVHVSQKIRKENLEIIKQLIAKCMPSGAKKRKLSAVLGTYGFSRRTIREYLEDLRDSGNIIWDPKTEVWKLPTEERENQQ